MKKDINKNKAEKVSPMSKNGKLIIILCALLIVGTYYNGIAAIYHALICVTTSVVLDYFAFKLIAKKSYLSDMSAIVMGLTVSLLLPSSAPLFIGAIACAFGIIGAKLPFGNYKNTPFLPSAASIIFVAVCFPEYMSVYPAYNGGLNPIFSNSPDFSAGTSISDMLSIGDSINLNVFSLNGIFSGSYPGAIGTTSMLAMVGIIIFLLFTNKKKLISSFGFILSAVIFSLAFPRVNSGFFTSLLMELSAGSFMFTALILINDSVTSPILPFRSFLYGLTGGTIAMLLCRFSSVSDPSVLSVLAVNALWPVISGETILRKKKLLAKKNKAESKDITADTSTENNNSFSAISTKKELKEVTQ